MKRAMKNLNAQVKCYLGEFNTVAKLFQGEVYDTKITET